MQEAGSNSRAKLITMRLSHFCEKARWGLDRAQLPYVEESHVPLVHRLFTRRNEGTTVPLLVIEGDVLADSSAILAYADRSAGGGVLYPTDPGARQEAQEWEDYLDRELGPHVRRWLYAELLAQRALMIRLWSAGVPSGEARLAPLVYPLARSLVRKGYRITPEGVERSRLKIEQVFARVTASLADGRAFLVGDDFSAADLTFAALAAPLLLPKQCAAALPPRDSLAPALLEELSQFQDTPAGKFAMRLYERERGAARMDACS